MQRLRVALLLSCLGLGLPVRSQTSSPTPAVDERILVEEAASDDLDTATDTSSSITILEIRPETQGLTPLSEILSRQAGLQVRRYGGLGAFSTLSIRGSSPSQVTFYLDGVPMGGGDSGLVNLDDFPVGSLERVEIYRGSAPGRFPNAGIGGVVNLVTRRASSHLSVSAEGGQYATAGGRLAAGFRTGRVSGHATAHGLRSDGDFRFLDDNGTPLNPDDDERVARRNNHFDQMDGAFYAQFQASQRIRLELNAEAFGKDQGVPNQAAHQAEQTRFSSRRLTLSLGGHLEGFLTQGGSLQATVYGSLRREHYQDPLGEVGIGVQDERDRFGTAGLRLHALLPLASGAHRVSVLAEVQREDHRIEDLLGGGQLDSHRWSSSLILEDPVLFGQGVWELTPRLRLQRFENDFLTGDPDATSSGLTAVSPALGLRRKQGSQQWKANLGRNVRVPSFFELFGDRGSAVGNPNLEPETAWSADLGFVQEKPRFGGRLLRLEATIYASLVDDLIAFIQNSQRTFQPVNIGKARTLGLELAASGRLGPAEVVLAYTLQDARDRSEVTFLRGNQLPGRSRHHASAEVGVPLGWLRLGTTLELLSANYLDQANLHRAGTRFYQGLGLAADLGNRWPTLTLDLKNLWNEQTADVGGYPLPGRSVFFGLRWQSPQQP